MRKISIPILTLVLALSLASPAFAATKHKKHAKKHVAAKHEAAKHEAAKHETKKPAAKHHHVAHKTPATGTQVTPPAK